MKGERNIIPKNNAFKVFQDKSICWNVEVGVVLVWAMMMIELFSIGSGSKRRRHHI